MEHELEAVFAWLEAGDAADYQAGVLVLQKHCKNRSLVNGLLRKESPANREKLVYELVKIGCGGRMQDVNEVLNHFVQTANTALTQVAAAHLGIAQNQAAPFSNAVDSAAAALANETTAATSLPQLEQSEAAHVPEQLRPELDELTLQLNKVYQQRCQLSNSLATRAEKRRILEAGGTPEQPALSTEPGFTETLTPGAELATASTPGIDRAELVKQRNTLRSNISKAKKKAETSQTEEKRSEYAQKVGKWQVELDQVEMQLKA
jgi:hypothetical protein